MSIVNINRFMISLIATALIIAFVTPQNFISASELQQEFIYDENNEKLFLEKTDENGVTTATVTNENNEVVSTFSLDSNNNIAYSDGVALSSEELEQTKMLADISTGNEATTSENNIQTFASTAAAVKYSYSGTHSGSLWVVKAGTAAAAAAIAVLVPGLGWGAAWAAGSAIVGSSGTVYYSTKLYYGFTSKYMYTKRVTTFYKNSAKTQKLYGPVTAVQKNGI